MNIDKDLILFDDTVKKFYDKAITCDMKGIVKEVRYLELLTNRLRSNLHIMKDKQKTNFINNNSKYISAEFIIDECICSRRI